MASTALLMGSVPFYRPNLTTKRYLTPASFSVAAGEAPACWSHWSESSYTFAHKARYFVASDGVSFVHVLDLTRSEERAVYDLALAGVLQISHGVGAVPRETRAAVARWHAHGMPLVKELPARFEEIGHWSYTTRANYPQEPVQVIFAV